MPTPPPIANPQASRLADADGDADSNGNGNGEFGYTLNEFETALAARTALSAQHVERLSAFAHDVLTVEMQFATQILQRFADAVATAMSNPRAARSFLCDLDLRLVTRDHSWRGIFAKLQQASDSDGHLERVAMWNYLAYLCSRRDLLETVLANRKGLEDTNENRRSSRSDANAQSRSRLPYGLPVTLTIPYRGQLQLYLGEYVFALLDGYPPQLQGPADEVLRLRLGEQIVGRHPSCDLVVSANYSEVSRGHMMLEWYGDSRLTITDRSTHGTYVEAKHIAVAASADHEPRQVDTHSATANHILDVDGLTARGHTSGCRRVS